MTSRRLCWEVTFLSSGFVMTPFPFQETKKSSTYLCLLSPSEQCNHFPQLPLLHHMHVAMRH